MTGCQPRWRLVVDRSKSSCNESWNYWDPETDSKDLSEDADAVQADDSCEYSNDGECDEPEYCMMGTDTTDCNSELVKEFDKGHNGFVRRGWGNCCANTCGANGYMVILDLLYLNLEP